MLELLVLFVSLTSSLENDVIPLEFDLSLMVDFIFLVSKTDPSSRFFYRRGIPRRISLFFDDLSKEESSIMSWSFILMASEISYVLVAFGCLTLI